MESLLNQCSTKKYSKCIKAACSNYATDATAPTSIPRKRYAGLAHIPRQEVHECMMGLLTSRMALPEFVYSYWPEILLESQASHAISDRSGDQHTFSHSRFLSKSGTYHRGRNLALLMHGILFEAPVGYPQRSGRFKQQNTTCDSLSVPRISL